ncbi:hypothetical protein ACQ9LF_10175 [Anaerohalosphaeraceae bacterium U12dextr]
MAYWHNEPTNVQPTGSGRPLTGLVITWETVSVQNNNYYYPFIEWQIYLNGTRIHTSSSQDLRSFTYTGTLTASTNYTITVDMYCNKRDIYGEAYPYYQTFTATATFRTIEYPQSFSLTAPASGATGVARKPTLSWGASSYAQGYRVYINGALEATVATNSYTLTRNLDWSTAYTWYVQAYRNDNSGTYTAAARSFTVMAEPKPPTKPVIVAPANDSVDIPRSQQLQWKDGTGGDPAASYDIYFGLNAATVTNADTASSEFKTNQSHTGSSTSTQGYNPGSLGNNVDYYWRIDAKNTQGTTKGDTWHFKTIQVQLGTPIEKVYRKKLIALADNAFWYENASHNLVRLGNLQIVSGDGLDLTKPVSMLAAYQKVFIVNGSSKKVVDFSNTRLTVSTLTHIPQRGCILTQANGAAMVIDYIDRTNKYIYGFVTNGAFVTGQTASVTEDGIGHDYSVTAVRNISAEPLYYNWQVYPHNDDTATVKVNGTMPEEPTILALYRGRIVQSGDKNSPHIVYMAQIANPFNFSYGGDDVVGAVAQSSGYAGNIGDIVTAIIPYRDDYMIIGCSQTMWLMRGDPASGGSIDQISFTAGLFDKTSFAWDSEDNLYFLDCNGIYRIPAGFGAVEKLTQNTLPDFNTEFALTPDVHRVTVVYDRKKHGILICKTDVDTGDNQNYWLDLRTSGFFPEHYPADCSVYAAGYYSADDPAYRELLLGCRDGYIRIFDPRLYKDQASSSEAAIQSWMLIGPGHIAAENKQGILTHLLFVLSEESSQLAYELFTDTTAQAAIRAALTESAGADFKGTIRAGLSAMIRPRCRGAYLVMKLGNQTLDRSWAFEKITADIRQAGEVR